MDNNLGFHNTPEPRQRIRDTRFPIKKKHLIIVFVVVVAIVGIIGYSLFHSKHSANQVYADAQPTLAPALATKQVNQSYPFPIKDSAGKQVSQFTYDIEQAELRPQIVVQGQKAQAVDGKTFLILDLKLTNSYDQAIDVSTRNFVRFAVDGDTKDLQAADIHNDPVNVQAKSTKYTKIGLTVPSDVKKVILYVGDINASKSQYTISFH